MLAGWIANDLTSATLARSENNSRLSMNFCAWAAPPLISNVKIEPPPLGKYLKDQPLVEKVNHPSISTNEEQQALYKKYFPAF